MVMKLLADPVTNKFNLNCGELYRRIGIEVLAVKGLETTPSQEA